MSGIVLSASVRQNLLSLQSTASLLATTQNNLATGNKVNSALDNPTNFFTAQGLNNRAGDISNLSRIVTLHNLNIVSAAKDSTGALTMEATARTYRYLDANEVEEIKKAAAKTKAAGAKK